MKKYLPLLAALLAFSGVAYASSISQTPALFETYVASTQGTSDTTLNIASPILSDGSTLSGYICVTVDSNTPSVEYECGNLSSNTITVTGRGLDSQTGTTTITSLKKVHRTGADVKITEYPTLAIIQRILSGLDVLENTLQYDNIATSTIAANRNNLATVGLVDDTAFNGAGVINATLTAKGVLQLSTGAQAANNTSTGSTGASLALTSSIASSTAIANGVVIASSTGRIDQSFLPASTTLPITLATSTYIGSTYAFDIGKHEQTFTASSTWAVPNGIHTVFVRMVGGGGQGGTGSTCSTGGSASGYAEGFINVSATTSVQVIVGAQAGSSATTSSSFGWPTFGIAATVGGNGGGSGSGGGAGAASAGGIGIGGTFDSNGAQAASCLAPASGGNSAGVGAASLLGSYGTGGVANVSTAQPGTTGAVILEW